MFSVTVGGTGMAFLDRLFNETHMKRLREMTAKGVTERVKTWYKILPDSYFDNPQPFPDGTSRRSGRSFVRPLANGWSYEIQDSRTFDINFKKKRPGGALWGLRLHHYGGTIRPVKAQALAIPITHEAVKRKPKNFPHKLFVVDKNASGEKIGSLCWADEQGRVHAAYLLRKSATIRSLKSRYGVPAVPENSTLNRYAEQEGAKAFQQTKDVLKWQQTQK